MFICLHCKTTAEVNTDNKIILRDATQDDAHFIAQVVLAAVGACDFVHEASEMPGIEAVCNMQDTLYSYLNARIAEKDGKSIACLVSYPGDNYAVARAATFERALTINHSNPLPKSDMETGEGEYYLDSLAVIPEYRGNGLGKTMLRDGIEKARLMGYDTVSLIVECDHPRLRDYYASLGFVPEKEMTFLGEAYLRMVLKIEPLVRQELASYVRESIIPRYDSFDPGHRRDHARSVILQAMRFACIYKVDPELAYVAAAYHDTGLCVDRKTHHLVSGQIIRADEKLRQWFNAEQIETIAQAAEDHRASSDHEPRTIYGRIIAEADRLIDPETVIRRTVQYGLAHYPELDREGHWNRTLEHLHEKYAEGGYLKLWIPESPNAARLEELRSIIRDEQSLRVIFERYYSKN